MIVATTIAAAGAKGQHADRLRSAGVEVLELGEAAGGVDLEALLEELGRRQWTYLLVEGGRKVLQSFVRGKLADELIVFVSARKLGSAGSGLPRFDIADVAEELSLARCEQTKIGEDVMRRYLVQGG